MAGKGVVGAVLFGLLAMGLGACGSKKSASTQPPDPVTMALQAPGVRTVVIPKQRAPLTIVVPPCSAAQLKQETTRTPPGSNQIVVPTSALDQTVAIQPCMQGAKNARGANTVLLGPGGSGSPQASKGQSGGQPQNQLIRSAARINRRLLIAATTPLRSAQESGVVPASMPSNFWPFTFAAAVRSSMCSRLMGGS